MLITSLTGRALRHFLLVLGADSAYADSIHTLRIHQHPDGTIVYKVNSGTWSPPEGELDPTSDLAARLAN